MMKSPAILFALPIEASVFLSRLADLKITGKGTYEGRLDQLPLRVGVSGMGYERSLAKARELLSAGIELLVVCGFAAGLDDTLVSGDLVVAASVLDDDSRSWVCDQDLICLASGICGSRVCEIACIREVVCSSQEKSTLAERSGCAAADMESGAAASVAYESGAPLVVVRTVVDGSKDYIPNELAGSMRPDGSIKLGELMWGILRRPQIVTTAVGLALKSRKCAHRLADFLVEFLPLASQTDN